MFYLLLFCLVASHSAMAASSSTGAKKRVRQSLEETMRPSDLRALLGCGTKTGICKVLETLQRAGLLCTQDSNRKLRRTLQRASVTHGNAMTPYGTVVQKVDLGIPGVEPWEYCHPLAYLRYINTLNNDFGEVMRSCIAGAAGEPLTVILYMDELCPGNPYRPEKARKLQGVYWCIQEWPDWILSRSAMWPVFGVLRSATLEKMRGGIGAFYAKILEMCFLDGSHTMSHGAQLMYKGQPFSVTFKYGGFLADEDCLKKVHNYMGAQGIKACMDCSNLMKVASIARVPPGCKHISTPTLRGIERNDNEDIWRMADDLTDLVARGLPIKETQTSRGLKYCPYGLLSNIRLRAIHRPIDHYLRDWMHILVSGGTGQAQLFALGKTLCRARLPTSIIQTYSLEYTLPSKYGKVSPAWTDKARFEGKDFSSFASPMLTLVPIIGAYLVDHVRPLGILEAHIQCWLLLVEIIGLLSCGGTQAVEYMDLLAKLIGKHHRLYCRLYRVTKPKWHHMLHLPDQYRAMKKVISCFVTERKHRALKQAALYVFRHIEHTSLASLVSQQCEQIIDGHSLFQRAFLVHPSPVELAGLDLTRSTAAVLDCSGLHSGDIIYVAGGNLARITAFWQSAPGVITAQCTGCELVDGSIYRDSDSVLFVPHDTIVDACAYRKLGGGDFRVLLPFLARFR